MACCNSYRNKKNATLNIILQFFFESKRSFDYRIFSEISKVIYTGTYHPRTDYVPVPTQVYFCLPSIQLMC